jgi:hypothetical protein
MTPSTFTVQKSSPGASAVAGLDTLPLDAVQLVAVANTVTQERVRDLLTLTDFSPRVAVFPPWFVAS